MLPSREASPLLETPGLPDGVVTTLFTDIEGSTRLGGLIELMRGRIRILDLDGLRKRAR